jgi:CHAT domain-containing protein/Tfp pilus assembly protein PilF
MWIRLCWTLLTTLIGSIVLVDNQCLTLMGSELPGWAENSSKAQKRNDSESGKQHSSELRRKAEAIAKKAAAQQKSQTSASLTVAVAMFRESARLFEAADSPEQAAAAYLQAGEIYFTFSQYQKARGAYRQALKLGTVPETRCRALNRVARTYATTGPLALAERSSQQALNMCELVGEQAWAEALEVRGEALESIGDHSKSVECFERARKLFVAAKDDGGEAQTLLMLAVALFSNGKQTEGLKAAGEALRLWSAREDRYGIARVRSVLGIFAITRGQFETAQCNYKIAEPILRNIGNKDDQASVLNGLGYASREMGDWQRSLEYYRNAKAIFARVHDLLGEHESINGMGKALLGEKNYGQLLPLYTTEIRLAREAGDSALTASSLADLATVYEAEKRYAKAETLYRRALETYRAVNHLYGEGDILIRLGRLQANRGKYQEAIELLDRANSLKEKTEQIEEVAKVRYELARIYLNLNRLEDARLAIESTIEIIESQRVTISHFDSRASYFASVHRYYALYIQLLMVLHLRDPGAGFAAKAFDASESSKVRSLLDLLTTAAQNAPCEELMQTQLQGGHLGLVQVADTRETDGLPAPTLSLKEVQAELNDDDTLLLEYALGDDKSYLWAVDQDRITSYELPDSDQIRKLVERLRETLAPPVLADGERATDYQARTHKIERAYEVNARQLSRLLLGQVNLGTAKRILIVPDGSLQYVPFAALPLLSPGLEREPLIVRYEVDILPSASVLETLRKAAAGRAPPTATIAIFADPVFDQDDPRVLTHGVHDRKSVREQPRPLGRAVDDNDASRYVSRLPASREEANAIASIFDSQDNQTAHIALDFDASRDYVLKEGLAQYRLIHFATHGVVDPWRPEMSGLILSLVDRRGRKQDGYLRLGDIYKLKLTADLVVLSSCDSALGKDLESEGIIGLPRGFLYAGAKSVIASTWKVNDDATARLMSALYTRIHRGENPGSALRGAQLEMAHDERWSKPYYWAAFELQGDYR